MSRASPALAAGSAGLGGPGGSPDLGGNASSSIASFRNQANLKSIARSDPAVQAIIETSVYATIYHYEPDAGEWVKQKAEGPLFVVRRDRTPEHAIFMLNRQTVKNVTLPLVRGEMKVTAVGAGMLQIARRGESVWFSEGEEGVERFRQAILAICGEPSARPAAGTTTTAPSVGSSASASASPVPGVGPTGHVGRVPSPLVPSASTNEANGGAVGDGFTRLFAGLMPVSASPRPRRSPPILRPTRIPGVIDIDVAPSSASEADAQTLPGPADSTASNAADQETTTTAAVPNVRTTRAVHTTTQTQTTTTTATPAAATYQGSPQSVPTVNSEPAPSAPSPPPAAAPFVPPPGQTVDDLLNSILGVSAFSPVPVPTAPAPNASTLAPLAPLAPNHHSIQNHSHHTQQAYPAHSHAASALSPPPPPPPSAPDAPPVPFDTRPTAEPSAPASADDIVPPPRPAPSAPAPESIHLGTGSPFPGAASPFPSLPMGGPGSGSGHGPGQGYAHAHAPPMPDPGVLAREAISDLMARGPDVRAGGKEAFVRTVMGLMMYEHADAQNEPRFVDDLWINYLRLMGGAGGAPG